MKGCDLKYCLLTLAIACIGCRASIGTELPDDKQGSVQGTPGVTSIHLPGPLIGVWYPDDREGALKCGRYRALSDDRKERDDGVIALVGSLVVTANLIHVYREYGEGDFHVIERVEPKGNDAWRVTARLGIDSMPDEQSGDDRVVSRLSLIAQKLQWQSPEQSEGYPSRYFRCGAVPRAIHAPVIDEKSAEASS